MASSKSNLAFADIKNMHIVRRVGGFRARWTPAFASNDKQLLHVLVQRAWQYMHSTRSGKVPSKFLDSKEELQLRLAAVFEERKREWGKPGEHGHWNHEVHKATVERLGYLELQTAVAYRSWRLGQTSTDIAANLGITPANVRTILYRICLVARKLGYKTFTRHPTTGRPKVGKHWTQKEARWTPELVAEALKLRKKGRTWGEIAVELRFNTGATVIAGVRRHQKH